MVRHGFGGGRRYVHVPFVQRACTMHLSLHVLMDRSFRGSLASMAGVNFWRIPTWPRPRRPVRLLVDRCKCFVPCLPYRNHQKINLWGIYIYRRHRRIAELVLSLFVGARSEFDVRHKIRYFHITTKWIVKSFLSCIVLLVYLRIFSPCWDQNCEGRSKKYGAD
jgi:hypothetical protein